ncbi:MAG: 2-oxo acid dehydrogenase subunit E2 [Clostridiales bacterium]|nr:2-oxo acid dehydrogenase subunit E2 [Clostridiales bacterium]
MIKKIVMPAAGQTTDAATVVSIKASVGDKVKRGDVLLEVETDKATLPIESVASGFVCEICVEEYQKIDAGTLLMEIGSEEDLAAAKSGKSAPAPEIKPEEVPAEEPDDDFAPVDVPKAVQTVKKAEKPAPVASVRAMPNAKAAAKEAGIDLASVTPSNGEFITKRDVEGAAKAAAAAAASDALKAPAASGSVPTSVMRDMLASKLAASSVPVQTVTRTVNASALAGFLSKYSELNSVETRAGDAVMLALSRLSDRFPAVCMRAEKKKGLVKTEGCVFGLAYTGLNGTVPAAAAGIEKLGLAGLARINREAPALLERGDMSPVGPVSLTVYDLSGSGADGFIPTVSAPELMSVGIGRIREAAVLDSCGQPVIGKTFELSISYDARYVDPPVAAELISQLAALLEEPALML